MRLWLPLLALSLCACGPSREDYERVARAKLADDGYTAIRLSPTAHGDDHFSFEAERGEAHCQGRIMVDDEQGALRATVYAACQTF